LISLFSLNMILEFAICSKRLIYNQLSKRKKSSSNEDIIAIISKLMTFAIHVLFFIATVGK
jgi:hypothetical protein